MLAEIGSQFQVDGTFASCERYTGGHINDTYFAEYRSEGRVRRYVHQRINTHVFRDAHALIQNVGSVTRHIRAKLEATRAPDIDRRVLRVIPTHAGNDLLERDGEYWRTYAFVERTRSRVRVETPADAYGAARAFGEFAALLADLPVTQLEETIPGFHDTPARVRALETAIAADAAERAAFAQAEIALAMHLRALAPALDDLAQREGLPLRATHNDTKITNVLFDEVSGEAVCVVDLDTVMPGLTLYDAGEMIRTACTRAPEDEPDPDNVVVDAALLQAVVNGFTEGAADLLAPAERASLVLAGRVLAFENGVRFLTDYLCGDTYFRVHRPDQNLDRARAQLTLAANLGAFESVCAI
jgi:hypothetical protein